MFISLEQGWKKDAPKLKLKPPGRFVVKIHGK
jgi:hypothetical protein